MLKEGSHSLLYTPHEQKHENLGLFLPHELVSLGGT